MNLNDKSTIPIGWAASIVLAIIGVAFQAGISHTRFNALQNDWSQYKVQRSDNDRVMRQHELKLQRLDITLDNISRRLESIDKKLDNMDQSNRQDRMEDKNRHDQLDRTDQKLKQMKDKRQGNR